MIDCPTGVCEKSFQIFSSKQSSNPVLAMVCPLELVAPSADSCSNSPGSVCVARVRLLGFSCLKNESQIPITSSKIQICALKRSVFSKRNEIHWAKFVFFNNNKNFTLLLVFSSNILKAKEEFRFFPHYKSPYLMRLLSQDRILATFLSPLSSLSPLFESHVSHSLLRSSGGICKIK